MLLAGVSVSLPVQGCSCCVCLVQGAEPGAWAGRFPGSTHLHPLRMSAGLRFLNHSSVRHTFRIDECYGTSGFHVASMWLLCGFHVASMWLPCDQLLNMSSAGWCVILCGESARLEGGHSCGGAVSCDP